MKTQLLALALFGSVVSAATAGVTLNLTAGQLYDANGSIFKDGGLLQLVASTADQDFAKVGAGAFSSNDDIVLSSFALDSNTFMAGGYANALELDYTSFAGLGAGDSLALRWFPTLTMSSTGSSLIGGVTRYGQFTDSTWMAPSEGSTLALDFLNVASQAGSLPSTSGIANLTVVPEPSTYAAILGLATLGLVGFRRFRR